MMCCTPGRLPKEIYIKASDGCKERADATKNINKCRKGMLDIYMFRQLPFVELFSTHPSAAVVMLDS